MTEKTCDTCGNLKRNFNNKPIWCLVFGCLSCIGQKTSDPCIGNLLEDKSSWKPKKDCFRCSNFSDVEAGDQNFECSAMARVLIYCKLGLTPESCNQFEECE